MAPAPVGKAPAVEPPVEPPVEPSPPGTDDDLEAKQASQVATTSVTNPAGAAFGEGNFGLTGDLDYGDDTFLVDVKSNLTLSFGFLAYGETRKRVPNSPEVIAAIAAGHLEVVDDEHPDDDGK